MSKPQLDRDAASGATIEVRSVSRLHFGLMELCTDADNCFAGIGLTLENPCIVLRSTMGRELRPERKEPVGGCELHERLARLVAGFAAGTQYVVVHGMPMHSGLGAGTQLACAAHTSWSLLQASFERASSLNAAQQGLAQRRVTALQQKIDPAQWSSIATELQIATAERLAEVVGRGERSFVGLQSFLTGGLVFDAGRRSAVAELLPLDLAGQRGGDAAGVRKNSVVVQGGEPVSQREPECELAVRTAAVGFPSAWPIMLLRPLGARGESGPREAELLKELGRNSYRDRPTMLELARQLYLQVASQASFSATMSTLEDYLELAVKLFWSVQGGPYNGQAVTRAVELARKHGLRGVGQSSWGPTVFGFCEDAVQAQRIVAEMRQDTDCELEITLTRASNQGALWRSPV